MLREKENTDVFRPKEGPRGTPFLEVGLNFKVSGQRQLNEAGFQTARGAPLLATHAWPRSQPGTVTRPQGKRQQEPRGGFRINSKKSASPTPPCRQPAERSKSPQGQALGRRSLAGVGSIWTSDAEPSLSAGTTRILQPQLRAAGVGASHSNREGGKIKKKKEKKQREALLRSPLLCKHAPSSD